MKTPFFISFDGPKGTGKSSIIQEIYKQLQHKLQVQMFVEKELDPYREEVKALLQNDKMNLTKEVEAELLKLLVKGRQFIGNRYIKNATTDIVLIDRWYPSDAVFRKFHHYDECLKMNEEMNVIVPHLIVATTCDPKISLERAMKRPDGLRSLVVKDLNDQIQTTERFEQIAKTQDWFVLHTEPPLHEVVQTLMDEINSQIK